MIFHLLDKTEDETTYEVFTDDERFLGTVRSYRPTSTCPPLPRGRPASGRLYLTRREAVAALEEASA